MNYVIKDGQVIIVDEFTGRMMPGRRWSDGLHQAIESKEGVKIAEENQTLATITFQNYFRMYKKLAGMTGTADTEAAEFQKIYKLEVMVIPTNKPMIRNDFADVIYRTQREKYKAVVEEVKDCYQRGQPVLVGTISIENSEKLSQMLKQEKIPHQVLNAKYHEMEANIIAQAGRYRTVTISTNMAGRGTDIMLGGNPEGAGPGGSPAKKAGPGRRPGGLAEDPGGDAHPHLPGVPESDRGRRAARPRDGTARVPADRQPAPGPVRPPGRPGDFPVLPLPGG